MPQTITVAAGMVSSGVVTLVANDVATVRFVDNIEGVDVISDGSTDVWFTTDGSTPTMTGANGVTAYRLPPGGMVTDRRATTKDAASGDTVKLLSASTVTVTVQRT